MKKKLIGLSTLLLVLLLGSFTTCYADLNRTWTENNIKNAIYNYRYSKGQSSSQIENYINTNANYITSVTNAFNSYNYVVILYQTSGSLSNMAFLVSNTNGNWYLNGSRLKSTNTNDSKNWIFPSSGTAWENNGWQDNFFNIDYYYTSKNIYENSSLNTIKLQANTCKPINLITSPYEDNVLNFDYPQSLISRVYTTNIQFYAVGVESNRPIDKIELIDENGNVFGGIQDFRTIYEEENNYSYQLWLYSKNAPSQFTKYKAVAYYNNVELGETNYTLQLRFIADGTITNNSGDTTGTINLDGTNQRLEEINTTLKEQQETTNILTGQENGEKAETFWNNLYENLFTMESGEVQEIIDNFVENTNLEELGTLEVEEQILNILNDEPRRFYNIMGRC